MIYLQLFLSFLQIGLFSIGGGYAAMPLIQAQVVTAHSWLTMEEFSHLVTISQMTPGPIAINGATFVGMQIAGFPGALAATLGCVAPSLVLVSVLASQVTSNVPAALLLSGFTQDVQALIVGTNLGGLGTLIASMASLISYRQIAREEPEGKGRYFLLFTASNLVFLAALLGLWALLA